MMIISAHFYNYCMMGGGLFRFIQLQGRRGHHLTDLREKVTRSILWIA